MLTADQMLTNEYCLVATLVVGQKQKVYYYYDPHLFECNMSRVTLVLDSPSSKNAVYYSNGHYGT